MIGHLYYFAQTCEASGTTVVGGGCLPQVDADSGTLNTAFIMVFVLIGAVATLFVIIAGLRYITAGGDPQKVATAKNELKYALIGLVIAGMSGAIVNFVVNRL